MIKIWTDGSAFPNPGPGGWAWIRSDGKKDCGGERQTTNNRMEMIAILEALIKLPGGYQVTVYSDSQYCVKGLTTWRAGWKKRNWKKKGRDMLNRDLWLALEDQIKRLDVSFEWVRGHSGDKMNDKADALATIGRESAVEKGAKLKSTIVQRCTIGQKKPNKGPQKPSDMTVNVPQDQVNPFHLSTLFDKQ